MEEKEISDFDVAIIDALKSIIEVIASKGIATHKEFALPFHKQMKTAMEAGNGNGAAVFHILLQYCNDYGAAHALYKTPPAGNA